MALGPGATRSNFAAVASSAADSTAAKMDTAESVADYGLEQFLLGTPSCIAGKQNRKVAFLPRVLSRPRVIQLAKKTWVGTLKSRGLEVE
jgi:short-subunit dehydrogenase